MEDTRPKFLNSVSSLLNGSAASPISVAEHPDVQRLIKQVVRGDIKNKELEAENKQLKDENTCEECEKSLADKETGVITAYCILCVNAMVTKLRAEIDLLTAEKAKQKSEVSRLKNWLIKINHRTDGIGYDKKDKLLNKLINISEWCEKALKGD